MRIIAGALKGRRLIAPAGRAIRPTSDSLRETLFNVLGPSVQDARVVDGFAGTGALGLEALSRGAAHVTFVEREPAALRAVADNVRACGVADACAIIRGDFLRARATGAAFDLILLDPPYDFDAIEEVLNRAAEWGTEAVRVVLEHSRRRPAPESAGPLRRWRLLVAGDSALSFYRRAESQE